MGKAWLVRTLRRAVTAVFLVGLQTAPSLAACVLRIDPADSERKILECGDDLIVRAARDTTFHEIIAPGEPNPTAIALQKGAVSVQFRAGASRNGFEVRTPRAIAAVRGTRWVVEADAVRTSVFVLSGEVSVTESKLGRTVMLGRGQGVDITDEADSGASQAWPQERVRELLSRVGE